MGIINSVIETLTGLGLRSEKAYPGRRMPHLTGVTAAVAMEEVDYGGKTAAVRVTVLSPAHLGGAACEEAAMTVGDALAALGDGCVQESCRFDSQSDSYYVGLLVKFSGTAVLEGWEPGFTVKMGDIALKCVVDFQARQELDEESGAAMAASPWRIQLEERFLPDDYEQVLPDVDFTLTILRKNSVEIFENCNWVSIQRSDSITELRQVRIGTAASRTIVGALE